MDNIKKGAKVRYRDPNWGWCTGYFVERMNDRLCLSDEPGGGISCYVPEHWVEEIEED